MNKRATRISVLAVLLIALAVRIFAAGYWHRAAESEGHLFRLGDSHSYWTLAGQIASGLPYQYGSPDASIFRAPVYPLVLAPFTWIIDERSAVWGARLFGCLMGTVSVALIMSLTKALTESICAARVANLAMLCSGLLAAIYPGAIGMSIVILSEAIFCPLMLGYLLLWQRGWKSSTHRQRWIFGAVAGCLAGLAVLARPSWLLYAPFLFGVGVILGPHRARHASLFAATLMGMVVTMSPWWIRNASVTGEFVLTTLQVGPSLYDGMHEGATGASDEGMAFMSRFAEEQLVADTASNSLRSTFEYRLNRRAQRAAVEWIFAHPVDVALLAWRKFLRTWSLWPNGGEVGSSTLRLSLTIGCFGVLALACIGSWLSGPEGLRMRRSGMQLDGGSPVFYWLPAVYFTLLHMIFVGSIRYREPALLVLTILAGIGLARIIDRIAKIAVD